MPLSTSFAILAPILCTQPRQQHKGAYQFRSRCASSSFACTPSVFSFDSVLASSSSSRARVASRCSKRCDSGPALQKLILFRLALQKQMTKNQISSHGVC